MANIPQIPPKPKKPNHTDPSSLDYTPPPRDAPPVANDSYNSATQVENEWDMLGERCLEILSLLSQKPIQNNTFKNPFDMDGVFAQQFLNTDKLFNKEKPKEESKIKHQKPNEEYFISSADKNIEKGILLQRFYQALHYQAVHSDPTKSIVDFAYGMECNASCVMYMLQSYGLIPPDMTRKEFEQIFTELTPFFYRHSYGSEHGVERKKDVSQEIYVQNPKAPIFSDKIKMNSYFYTKIFSGIKKINNAKNFILGIHGSDSDAIRPSDPDAPEQLREIFNKFQAIIHHKPFSFIRYYHKVPPQSTFKNLYDDLRIGLNNTYFDKFKSIMAGVQVAPEYVNGAAGHFTVLVKYHKLIQLEVDGYTYKFQSYLADDTLYGNTIVLVPIENYTNVNMLDLVYKVSSQENKNVSSVDGIIKFDVIYPNSAVGLK